MAVMSMVTKTSNATGNYLNMNYIILNIIRSVPYKQEIVMIMYSVYSAFKGS